MLMMRQQSTLKYYVMSGGFSTLNCYAAQRNGRTRYTLGLGK